MSDVLFRVVSVLLTFMDLQSEFSLQPLQDTGQHMCISICVSVVPRETVIVDRQCSVSISTQKNSISKTKVDIANPTNASVVVPS